MNPIVHLEDINKTYESDGISVPALQGISLSLRRGAFAVIVGPSGSGKSTLLNVMGALDQPSSGDVFVAGQSIIRLKPNERAAFRLHKIGFVFQAFNLIPVLTAVENIEYVQLLQGVDEETRRKRATALLKRVGLSSYLNTRPAHMSGGQQQRVAVARALAASPELVIADEPTANLDSRTGEELIDLFKELNREYRTTFILASHDPMVIKKTHHVIRLKDGRIESEINVSS